MLIVSHEAAFGLEGITVLMSIHDVLGKILGLCSKCSPSYVSQSTKITVLTY